MTENRDGNDQEQSSTTRFEGQFQSRFDSVKFLIIFFVHSGMIGIVHSIELLDKEYPCQKLV